jgi:hypothetical protein
MPKRGTTRKFKQERRTFNAMLKFANGEPLAEQEWADLSLLSLVDRNELHFGPGNIRWATSNAECIDNLRFYRSLRETIH